MRKVHLLAGLLAGAIVTSCGQRPSEPAPAIEAERPAPTLTVSPKLLDAHRIELTITTTLPLPVTVMHSINLEGQAPDATYIGLEGGRLRLDEPTTVAVLDTSRADPPLPSATYLASVGFYPRWGAEGNPEAARAPELHAETPFQFDGGGGSVADADLRNERQSWVMENLGSNDPWNKAQFERRLGPSQKRVSDLSPLHDAYYFAGADMTLIVNRVQNVVSVWRMGEATR